MEHLLVERELRDDLLKTAILLLELAQPLDLAGDHGTELLLPAIERRLRHAVLAADLGYARARLHRMQRPCDLLVRVLLPGHPVLLILILAKLALRVDRDSGTTSTAIGRLVRLGQLDKNPVARVRRPKEAKKARAVLSKGECARLLEACDPHLRIFCLGALLTGARPCELRALTWGDISFGMKTITIFRTKVGEGDAIPLHPELARELKLVKKRRARKRKRLVRDDEPVFLSSKGRPNWDHRWSWRKALGRAGLHRRKGLSLYSLRHSFATHYLERGSPADLQQLMGHASYATTERYVRAVGERARAGIEALEIAG